MAPSIRSSALAGLALVFSTAVATCPPFNGTLIIENYRLYPENLDFDSEQCKLYLGSNFNSTVMVYDPYTQTQDIISFPGITNIEPFHVSGIDYDPKTGTIGISANDGNPFVSNGANVTGGNVTRDNFIIRYNPRSKSIVFKADLAPFIQEVQQQTGLLGNGIQDMVEDSVGNSYTYITFGARGLAKISPHGNVSTWYATDQIGTPNPFFPGIYGGMIFHAPSNKIIITDSAGGRFNTFDAAAAQGVPTTVDMTGFPSDYTGVSCDGLLNPSRYVNQSVLLCSEDAFGTSGSITVFRTSNNWVSAKYVGSIANDDPLAYGSIPSATVQIANSLYISPFFATDGPVQDTAGNRTSFPLIDITAKVDALVLPDGATVSKTFC
ncbi:hypothetical protein BKA61DRAFT_517863 [Leptodontidium sp. MPI-SDFR-AT-0119]|nr:hypothetical protein BKA61DRAFT_517863 [Leptodontidium sp. MPI-SDFR-AT-0119]